MKEVWIGYNGVEYSSLNDKINADLKYIAELEKKGVRTFIGMDGKLYCDEKDYLLANREWLKQKEEIHFTR